MLYFKGLFKRKPRVKGNISSDGEKIAHEPGSLYYDKTRIDRSEGERWFKNLEDAEAAGWRRPGDPGAKDELEIAAEKMLEGLRQYNAASEDIQRFCTDSFYWLGKLGAYGENLAKALGYKRPEEWVDEEDR